MQRLVVYIGLDAVSLVDVFTNMKASDTCLQHIHALEHLLHNDEKHTSAHSLHNFITNYIQGHLSLTSRRSKASSISTSQQKLISLPRYTIMKSTHLDLGACFKS